MTADMGPMTSAYQEPKMSGSAGARAGAALTPSLPVVTLIDQREALALLRAFGTAGKRQSVS